MRKHEMKNYKFNWETWEMHSNESMLRAYEPALICQNIFTSRHRASKINHCVYLYEKSTKNVLLLAFMTRQATFNLTGIRLTKSNWNIQVCCVICYLVTEMRLCSIDAVFSINFQMNTIFLFETYICFKMCNLLY